MTLPLGARRARLLAVLSGLLLAVVWPTAAYGHASPIGTTPADGQVLTASPAELTVTFSEPVRLGSGDNALLDAKGVPQPAEFEVDGAVLTIRPEEPLATGTHVVTWRVVSIDSHPVTGGFSFAVGEETPGAIAVPTSQTQRELDVVRTVVEALRYAGVLGLAGLSAFWLRVAPRAARRDRVTSDRVLRAGLAFGVLAVLATLVLAPLTSVWRSGGALSSLVGADAWRDGLGSAPGVAVASTVAGVALLALRRTRLGDLASAVGIALLLASLLPVGHTRGYGPAWLVLAADLVHVGAGALWWGGLIGLVIVLAAPVRVAERAASVARFSSVAAAALVALVVAGVVLFWRIAGSWPALWETGYGRVVLVKAGLLLPVLAVALWNRTVLVRRLSGRESSEASSALRRTVGLEALLVAAVLIATGALVGQTPPARDLVRPDASTVQRLDRDPEGADEGEVAVAVALFAVLSGVGAGWPARRSRRS